MGYMRNECMPCSGLTPQPLGSLSILSLLLGAQRWQRRGIEGACFVYLEEATDGILGSRKVSEILC